jgi:thioredoxin-related protein
MDNSMKKVNRLIILLTILWVFMSCTRSSEQENNKQGAAAGGKATVVWYNFNEGLKLATEKRRPVVMDFYADWCGWCRKMEAEVFNDPEVAAKLRNDYICIRLHTDRNYDETIKYKNHVLTKQEFAAMLGVVGLPTVVFLDRGGGLITKIPGYINKSMFLPLLNYIKDECYLKKIPLQDYMDGKSPCDKK